MAIEMPSKRTMKRGLSDVMNTKLRHFKDIEKKSITYLVFVLDIRYHENRGDSLEKYYIFTY